MRMPRLPGCLWENVICAWRLNTGTLASTSSSQQVLRCIASLVSNPGSSSSYSSLAGQPALLEGQQSLPVSRGTHHAAAAAPGPCSWLGHSSLLWPHFQQQQQQHAAHCGDVRAYSTGTQQPPTSPLQLPQQQHKQQKPLPGALAAASEDLLDQITSGSDPTAAGPLEGICRRKNLRIGWKKLHFVLKMIRRAHVEDALAQLAVNPKKGAMFAHAAVANARNNALMRGADATKLVVDQAFVNKGQYSKYLFIRGRGFSSVKEHKRTHLTVVVKEDPNTTLWTKFLPPYALRAKKSNQGSSSSSAGAGGSGSAAAAAAGAAGGAGGMSAISEVRRRASGKGRHNTRSVSANRVRMVARRRQ